MKKIIFFLLVSIAISCSDDCCTVIDTNIEVVLKDSENNDLLNPDIVNTYNTENIEIIYIVDGEEISASDYNSTQSYTLDSPKGYCIFEDNEESDDYTLAIYSIDTNEGENTLYVKWNSSDIDTFSYVIEKSDNLDYCSKVILNGETAWQTSDKTSRIIEIVK